MSILKEGYPFIVPFKLTGLALLAAAFLKIWPGEAGMPAFVFTACIVLGTLFVVFALFCAFFFRDPKIKITQGDGIILSPCNGTVMEVAEEGNEKVIRVFLSIFSVHLQRSPAAGTVTGVVHKKGKFLAAWDPRAHVENEQNVFTIQAEGGIVYTVRQIAGLVARRCVSWVKPGDVLKAGDKIGMIKFSSQVDLHLPKDLTTSVNPGDKVKAGISIMAKK